MRRLVQSSIRRIDDRPGDTAFHYDCPLEQGRLELSVSRETSPAENPRVYWGNFASKSVSIVPESEFAFSSVRVPSLTLNSGVARMRLDCETSVRRTQIIQGARRGAVHSIRLVNPVVIIYGGPGW